MNVLQMEYRGYRNLQEGGFSPSDGINVIYGKNANGKTNLLEAMWLFTGGRSFRGARDQELVRAGAQEARLSLTFFSGGREQRAELTLRGGARQAVLNGVPKRGMARAHEMLGDGPVEHLEQWGIIILRIKYDDGIEVKPQLLPGDDLQQLFQRAATARQGDDGIGQGGHHPLAFVHGFRHTQLGQSPVVPTLLHHEAGDDARHLPTCGQSRIGHGGHQPHVARPVHHANATASQQ